MRTSQRWQLMALLLLSTFAIASAQDVSAVLAQYPKFSKFNELLKSTGVLAEVNVRTSLTLLMPEDGILNGYLGSHPSYTTQMVADVMRYHCLLQYFGGDELKNLNALNGGVITTLYQTTGRANGLDGFVNMTAMLDGSITVGPSTPGAAVQANIITNVTQYPYNYSFLQISAVLEPLGLAAAQLSPTTPPAIAPVPAPMTPGVAPVVAPAVAPVASPVSVPAMAPAVPVSSPAMAPAVPVSSPVMTPIVAPVVAPVLAPVVAPVVAPVPAPVAAVPAPVGAVPAPVPAMATPVPAPATTPVTTPVVAPSPPAVNGPAANSPMAPPNSSGSSMRFDVAALVSTVFVAVVLL